MLARRSARGEGENVIEFEKLYSTNSDSEIEQLATLFASRNIQYQVELKGNSPLVAISIEGLPPDAFYKYKVLVESSKVDEALNILESIDKGIDEIDERLEDEDPGKTSDVTETPYKTNEKADVFRAVLLLAFFNHITRYLITVGSLGRKRTRTVMYILGVFWTIAYLLLIYGISINRMDSLHAITLALFRLAILQTIVCIIDYLLSKEKIMNIVWKISAPMAILMWIVIKYL